VKAGATDTSRRLGSNALSRLGASLIVFVIFFALAYLPITRGWDSAVTRWLRGAPTLFHRPATILVALGELWLVVPVVAIITGLLFVREKRAMANAAWLIVLLVIGSVTEVGLKAALAHASPSGYYYQVYPPFGLSGVTVSRFPSGHALRTTLIARVALWRLPWLETGLVVSMMAAVTYSHIHSLSEALGGVCLGWVVIEAGSVIRTRCNRAG
jgi:hypothetical protein